MKLGRKILSFVLALALVAALVPGMSFDAFADEISQQEQTADYLIYLTVENGEGKAYKNSAYPENAIELPEGLSYANGTWIMNGFDFSTTNSYGICFSGYDETKLELASGSENSIKVVYPGSGYFYGLYADGSLTFSGSGSLDISASGAESVKSWGCYAVYTNGNITVNGGLIKAAANTAYYSYGVFSGCNTTVNGGSLIISNGDNIPYCGVGLYCCGELNVNGGTLNADGGSGGSTYGAYAAAICVPFGGTTVFSGSYANLYFNSVKGNGIEKNGKSDYMSYSGVYSEEAIEKYGLRSAINVKGYYNNNWIKTTYADQGYNLSTADLGNAKVISDAEFVYGGHYVLLSYKVTAAEAVNNGHIGIWTDVQIGDNDYAPISVIKDEDTGKTVGFELVDNHTGYCSNLNAKYMCYFDGYMIASAIDGAEFEPAATYWFGYYGSAGSNVFNNISGYDGSYIKEGDEVVGLSNVDSGMAVSWNVNLAEGETKTYYALLGIGDATFKEKPKFAEESIPEVTEEGRVNAVVNNTVQNKEDAGNLTLSVITTGGKEFTVGDAPLELLTEDDEAPFIMTAAFTDRLINARPGNYSVKTVRATNKGGMFTDYTFADEDVPSTEVSLIPRSAGLDLRDTKPGFESLLYEGWEWNKEANELSFFGLDQDSEEGIQLPGGVNAIVEEEGVKIRVSGEGKPAISAEGSLVIKNKNGVEGNVTIDAPVGISAAGDVLICTPMELNASETAIQVGENGTLKIREGASLTINLTGEDAVMFRTGDNIGIRVSIPEGYAVEGGTIDENGFLVLDPGVSTLRFIDAQLLLVTLDYNGHGPVDVATMSVAKHSYIERPEDPQAFGWAFQGWHTESGRAWNFLTEYVTEKITLFAKWTETETSEKEIGDKTVNTGVAKSKASTEIEPERQEERGIVDEIIANKSASTAPEGIKSAVSKETYEEIAEDVEDGGKIIFGLRVDLVGCETEEESETETQVTISFDVKPRYQIRSEEEEAGEWYLLSNEELNGKTITFRLPLPEIAKNYEYARVEHHKENGDVDVMYLPVCASEDGGKTEYYVTVNATEFSIFSMNFTNEKPEEEEQTPEEEEQTPEEEEPAPEEEEPAPEEEEPAPEEEEPAPEEEEPAPEEEEPAPEEEEPAPEEEEPAPEEEKQAPKDDTAPPAKKETKVRKKQNAAGKQTAKSVSGEEKEKNWWKFDDTGWILHEGSWYNIQENRLMKGWYFEEEDNRWYYLDPVTGIMQTGWVEVNGRWFFLNPENSRQTWFKDADGRYHFGGNENDNPFGAMLTDCVTPDGNRVDETGVWVKFEEL